MRLGVCLALAVLSSCKSPIDILGSPMPLPGPQDVSQFDRMAVAMEARALDFLRDGYIVSSQNGSDTDLGDAAKYSGILLATLSCREGSPILERLASSIHNRHGQLVRWEPNPEIGEQYGVTSRDAAIGVWFGLTLFSKRCPEAFPLSQAVWLEHTQYLDTHNQELESNSIEDRLTDGMLFLKDEITRYFFPSLSLSPKMKWEGGIIGTVMGTKAVHGHCHSLDLAMLQVILASKLGHDMSRFSFDWTCELTKDLKLPIWDWYCRRDTFTAFLTNWREDIPYRHQICPWQNGDPVDGYAQNGVDWLLAYRLGQLTEF